MSKPFTVSDLAEHFQCDPKTIYRAIKDRDLRAFRLGGKLLRILPEDAEAWLKKQSTLSEPMTLDGSMDDGSSHGARDHAADVTASTLPRVPR